jgi:cytochrome c553
MKVFALVSLMSGAALAADPKFELKGDATKGQATFNSQCAACHGEKGLGDGAASAALTPKPTNFTDPANADRLTPEYVYRTVKEGGAAVGRSPLMVAWAESLNDQELRDVAAYVLQFKPTKGTKKPATKK